MVTDKTEILRLQTYWASYNRIADTNLFNLTGQWEYVAKYGDHYTFDKTARANIFRRDVPSVVDEATYVALMRSNNFQTDPLSVSRGNDHS